MYSALGRWEEALRASNKATAYWKKQVDQKRNENKKQSQSEIFEARARKANVMIHLGRWKDAENLLD